jgi:restriction system protein
MTTINIQSRHPDQIDVGTVRAVRSARHNHVLRYGVDLRHRGLNVRREVSAPGIAVLQEKIEALVAGWDDKYDQLQLKLLFRDGKAAAEEATAQAQERLNSISRILSDTLDVDDAVDWRSLKDHGKYERPAIFPEPPPIYNPEPSPDYLAPPIGFFDVLLSRKRQLIAQAEEAHESAWQEWQTEDEIAQADFHRALDVWTEQEREFWEAHDRLELEFDQKSSERNAAVDEFAACVSRGDHDSITEYADLVLESSDYGVLFEKSYDLEYDAGQKLLKVRYLLPNQAELPTVKSVKFNKASGELIEVRLSDKEAKANFESAAYQIALRTLHEIFEADIWEHIQNVLFNGVVEFIDKRTGHPGEACILSVLADRETFSDFDLAHVDPKACFKSLKGISAASLASLTPIAPVMEMDRRDRRFVEAHEIADSLEESENLASMPWEEFEHLVRELFEKEFASRCGDVKITQASRDGGVDAIAFDPDPITGGKIVIQAKRYTRTVGVSAVRDLFGTVMNEGATKGILVTTSDYGPDAHQFATGKPLTLLSGSHLLHMLQRHGYKAKIDLREARDQLHSERP